jgi:hypothetical protein
MRISCLMLGILMTACGAETAYVRVPRANGDGYQLGYQIDCRHAEDCREEAADTCKYGYDVIQYDGGFRTGMLIRCQGRNHGDPEKP